MSRRSNDLKKGILVWSNKHENYIGPQIPLYVVGICSRVLSRKSLSIPPPFLLLTLFHFLRCLIFSPGFVEGLGGYLVRLVC